ncbi:hypothetical protein FACS1894204_13160 [Synergistales bacterium]|nr:hypothetical protein FACS1894204_13160 [Synergistales bacterium]
MPNRITERDRQIIALINKFGFFTADRLSKIYAISQNRIYRRLKVLHDNKLLQYKRFLNAYPGVYWPTKDGKELSDSQLTPIHAPRIATFEHELRVIDVYISVKEKYGDSVQWITAREIISNRIAEARDAKEVLQVLKSKIPDAILIRENKKFAVEVELSVKSRQRLKKILTNYAVSLTQSIFDGVLYYITKKSVAERLERLITETNLTGQFRILRLEENDHPNTTAK